MESLSKALSDYMVGNSVIREEDNEIISYGIDLFLSSMFELISIFLVSVFVGNLKETLFFFIAFIPLRIYAGGYHANTKLRCYIVSLVVYVLFTLLMGVIPQAYYVNVSLLGVLLSFVIVYIFAPIVHNNKSVNSLERKTYRKFSIIISVIEILLIFILLFFKEGRIYGISLSMGQLAESGAIIISVIKNIFKK